MDAAGLGAVISARALANGVRIPLDLLTPSEAVCRLLRRTHLDQNFRMYDSLDAAIDDSRETLSAGALSAPANPRSRRGRSDSDGGVGQQADRGCTRTIENDHPEGMSSWALRAGLVSESIKRLVS